MEHPPIKGTPLPAAAENWESEGGTVIASPAPAPTLRLVASQGIPVNNRPVPLRDDKSAQLRAIVATIDHEIACLPIPATDEVGDRSTDQLIVSWNALVSLLALGPAPETRECPACAQIGMLNATRCGYCWVPLQPLAPAGSDAP